MAGPRFADAYSRLRSSRASSQGCRRVDHLGTRDHADCPQRDRPALQRRICCLGRARDRHRPRLDQSRDLHCQAAQAFPHNRTPTRPSGYRDRDGDGGHDRRHRRPVGGRRRSLPGALRGAPAASQASPIVPTLIAATTLMALTTALATAGARRANAAELPSAWTKASISRVDHHKPADTAGSTAPPVRVTARGSVT